MIKDKFPKLVYDYNSKNYKAVDTDKFLFHHIPKTAGPTFRGILENFYLHNEVCHSETPKELQKSFQDGFGFYKLFGGHFSYGSIRNFLGNSVWVTF